MTMNNPPEGTETANAEAFDVAGALLIAAEELKTSPESLHWCLDKTWFRSEQGLVLAQDTVRITAWKRDEKELEACDAAKTWLETVLKEMDLKGSVVAKMMNGQRVVLNVDVDHAARLIGRRGATLQGISELLVTTMEKEFSGIEFHISVADKRDDRGDSDRRGDRGRSRDRDRDRDRRGDRGRSRDRDRERGGRTSEREEEALQRMAQNIAERVLETGEAEEIRKALNSYNRRIVHMAIKEIDGVGSRSLGEGNDKTIELFKEA